MRRYSLEIKLIEEVLKVGLVGVVVIAWLVWKLGEKAVEYHNKKKGKAISSKSIG